MPPSPDPIRVSLSTFAEFATCPVTNVEACVQRAIDQENEEYDPNENYYHYLIEGIVAKHQQGLDWSSLDAVIERASNPAKKQHFSDIKDAYEHFWKKSKFTYFTSDYAAWTHDGVLVSAWPQVGVEDRLEVKHPTRLWVRKDPPSKERVAIMLGVMHLAKVGVWPQDHMPALWDVRNEKFVTRPMQTGFEKVLKGIVAEFKSIYTSLSV